MLVLSRKPGETIQIGEEVTLTVLEVHGSRIRIGITAPDHITVMRGELTSAVQIASGDVMSRVPNKPR